MTEKEFTWVTEYASHLQARVLESAQFVSCKVTMNSNGECTVSVSDNEKSKDSTFTISSDYDYSKTKLRELFMFIFKGKYPKQK